MRCRSRRCSARLRASSIPRLVDGLQAVVADALGRRDQAGDRLAGLLGRAAADLDDLALAGVRDRDAGRDALLDGVERGEVIALALLGEYVPVAGQAFLQAGRVRIDAAAIGDDFRTTAPGQE